MTEVHNRWCICAVPPQQEVRDTPLWSVDVEKGVNREGEGEAARDWEARAGSALEDLRGAAPSAWEPLSIKVTPAFQAHNRSSFWLVRCLPKADKIVMDFRQSHERSTFWLFRCFGCTKVAVKLVESAVGLTHVAVSELTRSAKAPSGAVYVRRWLSRGWV